MKLSETAYDNLYFYGTSVDRAQFGATIQKDGLKSFNGEIVNILSQEATRLANTANPMVRTVQSTVAQCAFYASALAEYLAIVALAAAETGPVAAAIAAISALIGLIALLCS